MQTSHTSELLIFTRNRYSFQQNNKSNLIFSHLFSLTFEKQQEEGFSSNAPSALSGDVADVAVLWCWFFGAINIPPRWR